jgi:AP-4 complex subunit beta-1
MATTTGHAVPGGQHYPPSSSSNGAGGFHHANNGAPGVAAVPDSYFTESRKGEINELRNLLKGFAAERDQARKRDIIKKVIAYMTLGIDVSRLFTEMMLAIETRYVKLEMNVVVVVVVVVVAWVVVDVVAAAVVVVVSRDPSVYPSTIHDQTTNIDAYEPYNITDDSDLVIKKMVYLYLTNYARSHPELAQMCTNTLQKDCGNDDPMVRGLALRSLAGLGLSQMLEYISEPVRRGLTDPHAYVRKTAVLGALKVYRMDREAFADANFTDTLYDMLRDPDASVVANCVICLNEVMRESPAGGMAINRAIMLHLLNRIHEFNEFAKVQILDLVPRYIPADDDEAYQIMNLLDPVLRTTDSGATMATIKAFLSLADSITGGDAESSAALKLQIVRRVKAPLVTQISSGSSEIMYSLLKHVSVLTEIAPGVFDDEYRQFYVRYNEPTHVKYLKIAILPRLSNPDNAPDIVSELAECVHDTNAKFSKLAIRSMGQIADQEKGGPGAAEAIARRLVDMLDSAVEHVSSEAALALTTLVRKNPSLRDLIAPPLVRSLKYVSSQGKAAVIYLLAECGEVIKEAPYALERLIDSYDDLKQETDVKTALLTATVRLFFQRPPEVQRMLGRLLAHATNDVSSQDLHDRALLYYRLLRSMNDGHHHNLATLESIVRTDCSVTGPGQRFAEDVMNDYGTMVEEFNTLSILYGKPSINFIAEEFRVKYTKMPAEHPLSSGDSGGGGGDASYGHAPPPSAAAAVAEGYGMMTHETAGPVGSVASAAIAAPPVEEFDLLGFGGPPTPTTAAAAATATTTAVPGQKLTLDPGATMTGDEYQTQWGALPDAQATVATIPLPQLPVNADAIESQLARFHVKTMASGELATEFKFYLYAMDMSRHVYLIQSNIEKNVEPLMILTVKDVHGAGQSDKLVDMIVQALS